MEGLGWARGRSLQLRAESSHSLGRVGHMINLPYNKHCLVAVLMVWAMIRAGRASPVDGAVQGVASGQQTHLAGSSQSVGSGQGTESYAASKGSYYCVIIRCTSTCTTLETVREFTMACTN
jgi:hypothetical protein